MGNRAYVLIETAMGRSLEVCLALKQCSWVEYAERVAGPYDVVVIAAADGSGKLGEIVDDGIRSIDGVVRTVLCPISALFDGMPQAVNAVVV